MAQDLDDGEFWLPSQFLTDDDMLMEKKNDSSSKDGASSENEARVCFPLEFPYGFETYGASSSLSSPVESVVGSTETESDEEDFMAGLTRQMAHSTLLDDFKCPAPAFGAENTKGWVLAGSPQSTLCALGSWSARSAGSSRGSPSGPSQVSSPPSTPMNRKDDAWDLLYAAAGQVVRMQRNDEVPRHHQGRGLGLLGPPQKPAPVSAPVKNRNAGFYANQSLNHQQLQSNRFQEIKQQQLMKQQCSAVWGRQVKPAGPAQHQQQVANRARSGGFGNGTYGRPPVLSSSAWPPLQQPKQAGSGMRAVFLGGSGSRRESGGTGVFLPRRIGNPADCPKKPACSTVLLPARVVQALNLNFDDMGAQPRFGGGFATEHDALMARSNASVSQQKRGYRPQAATNHEIRLPQEWTY